MQFKILYKEGKSLFKQLVYSQMQFKNTIQRKPFYIYKLAYSQMQFSKHYIREATPYLNS